MTALVLPLSRALSVQLGDPEFAGVVWRSVLLSALFFVLILAGTIAALHHFAAAGGIVGWALDALGSIAAALLAMWLFLPVAAAIGTLYFERIARAVEHVYYPSLPPAQSRATAGSTSRRSGGVALRVLGLNACWRCCWRSFCPASGCQSGWLIASWAMGRGLFVAVAMRRMRRSEAEMLYRAVRPAALTQGAADGGGGVIFLC